MIKRIINKYKLDKKVKRRHQMMGNDVGQGLEPQAGNLDAVAKDFARIDRLIIRYESDNSEHTFTRNSFKDDKGLPDPVKTHLVLQQMAHYSRPVHQYLTNYAYQAGFLNAGENALKAFFMAGNEESHMLMLSTSSEPGVETRQSTFTVHNDGSITYEEQFDIYQVKDPLDLKTYESEDGKPVASCVMTSTIRVNKGKISHQFHDMRIEAKDDIGQALFEKQENKSFLKKVFSKITEKLNQWFGSPKVQEAVDPDKLPSQKFKL